MIEYPPILQGSAYLQLNSLRDYLVRMADELQRSAASAEGISESTAQKTLKGIKNTVDGSVKEQTQGLKSLITKTAAVIQSSIDSIETELHGEYLALSDFGEYREETEARFTATAENIGETFIKLGTA